MHAQSHLLQSAEQGPVCVKVEVLVGSPKGRQVAKCQVLWEQQTRGEVRQFTTCQKILDLRA